MISRIGCFDSNKLESFGGLVSLVIEVWKIQNWYKKSLLAGPLLNESVQKWNCMKWKSLCERVSGYLHDWVVKEGARRSWCLGPELEWKGFLARALCMNLPSGNSNEQHPSFHRHLTELLLLPEEPLFFSIKTSNDECLESLFIPLQSPNMMSW